MVTYSSFLVNGIEVTNLCEDKCVRWIICNFPALRNKNNMDLNTKRLRLTEYVGSMLNLKLGDSINRVLGFGTKATVQQIQTNLFRFSGTIVLQVLGSSDLLKYDDRTNDLDFVSRLRYTVKGPKNELGRIYGNIYTSILLIAGNSP